MTTFVTTACGPMTSLQDGGRFGSMRYGVSRCGAMDRQALATANALVGNAPGAAAIEFMLAGGAFTLEDGTARIAMAGAPFALSIDGTPIPHATSATLKASQSLSIGAAGSGIYAYLAVAGGFDLPLALGSLSLQSRAGIGGYQGRPLRAGDRLPLLLDRAPSGSEMSIAPDAIDAGAPIRVVLGPQDDFFSPDAITAFLSNPYTVSDEADRMGFRLAGPPIPSERGFNIVSDGLLAGSVQVPGTGMPIVLMADHHTSGGYPKIATVISCDLRVLAQRRPGAAVRFAAIDVKAAQMVAREQAALIAALPGRLRPARGDLPDVEELLGLNLAGAATDALASEP